MTDPTNGHLQFEHYTLSYLLPWNDFGVTVWRHLNSKEHP